MQVLTAKECQRTNEMIIKKKIELYYEAAKKQGF